MISKQAASLLCSDLRIALAINDYQALRSRLTLFELMYLQEEDESRVSNPNSRRLVLRIETHEILVCDEYDPDDNGRVHIVPAHRYGTFDREAMVLEYAKVTFDVAEIIYDQPSWPTYLQGKAPSEIIKYFTEGTS